MKHFIDLLARRLFTGNIHHDFSPRGEGRKTNKNPAAFGSFSARPFLPAVKRARTFCTEQNLVFKFEEPWSAYSDLNKLKAVWSRNFIPKHGPKKNAGMY
jgi:hypothetical protein